jgi:hypothetical protein
MYVYAAQIAAHARAVERHAHKFLDLHAKIDAEAMTIACQISTPLASMNATPFESIAEQHAGIKGGCSVDGAGRRRNGQYHGQSR